MTDLMRIVVWWGAVAGGLVGQEARSDFADLALAKVRFVRHHHVSPPSRTALVEAGLRWMTRSSGRKAFERAWRDGVSPKELASVIDAVRGEVEGDDAELLESFLDGVLRRLPGRAAFQPPNEYRARRQIAGNRYVGVGVQLGVDREREMPVITGVFPGGPARKAGLRKGDLVLEVDGRSARGLPLGKFIEYSRNVVGTRLSYTIRREGEEGPRVVEMVRAEVPQDSVQGLRRRADDRWVHRQRPGSPVAYLRIDRIVASTPHELRELEPLLRREGYRALVLDLRGTYNGAPRFAALVADAFLAGGEIGIVRRRTGSRRFCATRAELFRGWPLVVLIDERTRGTAEWIAAAWRRARRAVFVGKGPTAGEPWVEEAVPLPDGTSGIGMAVGRAAPGAGATLPVVPDVTVADDPKRPGFAWALVRAVRIAEEKLR